MSNVLKFNFEILNQFCIKTFNFCENYQIMSPKRDRVI